MVGISKHTVFRIIIGLPFDFSSETFQLYKEYGTYQLAMALEKIKVMSEEVCTECINSQKIDGEEEKTKSVAS